MPSAPDSPLKQSFHRNSRFGLERLTLTAAPRRQELVESMAHKFVQTDNSRFLSTFMQVPREAEPSPSSDASCPGPSADDVDAGSIEYLPASTITDWEEAFRASGIKEGMPEKKLQDTFVRHDICLHERR